MKLQQTKKVNSRSKPQQKIFEFIEEKEIAGIKYSLVKWVGYPDSFKTWINEQTLIELNGGIFQKKNILNFSSKKKRDPFTNLTNNGKYFILKKLKKSTEFNDQVKSKFLIPLPKVKVFQTKPIEICSFYRDKKRNKHLKKTRAKKIKNLNFKSLEKLKKNQKLFEKRISLNRKHEASDSLILAPRNKRRLISTRSISNICARSNNNVVTKKSNCLISSKFKKSDSTCSIKSSLRYEINALRNLNHFIPKFYSPERKKKDSFIHLGKRGKSCISSPTVLKL